MLAASNASWASSAVFALTFHHPKTQPLSTASPRPVSRPPPVLVLDPKNFVKHATYRFSLALQCVVNVGVKGSKPIRSCVFQAGTVDVVGCILKARLASK